MNLPRPAKSDGCLAGTPARGFRSVHAQKTWGLAVVATAVRWMRQALASLQKCTDNRCSQVWHRPKRQARKGALHRCCLKNKMLDTILHPAIRELAQLDASAAVPDAYTRRRQWLAWLQGLNDICPAYYHGGPMPGAQCLRGPTDTEGAPLYPSVSRDRCKSPSPQQRRATTKRNQHFTAETQIKPAATAHSAQPALRTTLQLGASPRTLTSGNRVRLTASSSSVKHTPLRKKRASQNAEDAQLLLLSTPNGLAAA